MDTQRVKRDEEMRRGKRRERRSIRRCLNQPQDDTISNLRWLMPVIGGGGDDGEIMNVLKLVKDFSDMIISIGRRILADTFQPPKFTLR